MLIDSQTLSNSQNSPSFPLPNIDGLLPGPKADGDQLNPKNGIPRVKRFKARAQIAYLESDSRPSLNFEKKMSTLVDGNLGHSLLFCYHSPEELVRAKTITLLIVVS